MCLDTGNREGEEGERKKEVSLGDEVGWMEEGIDSYSADGDTKIIQKKRTGMMHVYLCRSCDFTLFHLSERRNEVSPISGLFRGRIPFIMGRLYHKKIKEICQTGEVFL